MKNEDCVNEISIKDIETGSLRKIYRDTTKISGVYKIVNKVNGKYYIGSSVDILERIKVHRRKLNKNFHCNHHLQSAWNKYGGINFSYFIVEKSDPLLIFNKEQQYLTNACSDKKNCYNHLFDVKIPSNIAEWKRNMSEKGKQKIFTESHRKNISKSRKGKDDDINPVIYLWQNKNTGEVFTGRMYDWYTKYGFWYKPANRLVSGERKSYHGWSVRPTH